MGENAKKFLESMARACVHPIIVLGTRQERRDAERRHAAQVEEERQKRLRRNLHEQRNFASRA